MDERTRIFWMAVRQGLLLILGALETYLGLEKSREGRRDRMNMRGL
jgi:hypothetical protein